ncbi:MAG: hypothetical protein KIT84_20905 [Labilithrix sp.]|nr:hypothetical protein [Labilithrix sp.]MCW5813502.1 hypothetical protein [Labilithrix sp.]
MHERVTLDRDAEVRDGDPLGEAERDGRDADDAGDVVALRRDSDSDADEAEARAKAEE